jgi:DNA polymerase III sliding clamp (beta) subunit (PCNA family)
MNPITLPVAELKPALAGLGKVIGKRITLPVLGCVKIERTREGRIELTGTDLDRTATVQLGTPDQGEPATILVPLEDLANLTKSSGRNDALVLKRIEKDKAAIQFAVGGQVLEHRCTSLPVEEFPETEAVRGNPVTLDAALRRSIHDALACASTDETRLILNGAYLDVSKPGAHYVVGTDGRHLFSSNSFALDLPTSLVLPTHPFLGWKGFNEDGDWRLRVKAATKDQAPLFELATEHWRYLCRSIDGNYPNWRQVVPTGTGIASTVEVAADTVETIIDTITRLPDHYAIDHTIGVEVQGKRVHLLAKATADQPWTPIEVPDAKTSGADSKVFLNRLFLLKALRFGLTRLDIIDALTPLRFSAGGRQMIVQPIRPGDTPAPKPNPPPVIQPAAAQNEPAAQSEPPASNPPPQSAEPPKEETNMPENNGTHTTGAKRATTHAEAPKPALDLALAQLEVVRGDFRNAIAGLNKLGEVLKQAHRDGKASDKEISSVRQTLRSLQSVRI